MCALPRLVTWEMKILTLNGNLYVSERKEQLCLSSESTLKIYLPACVRPYEHFFRNVVRFLPCFMNN